MGGRDRTVGRSGTFEPRRAALALFRLVNAQGLYASMPLYGKGRGWGVSLFHGALPDGAVGILDASDEHLLGISFVRRAAVFLHGDDTRRGEGGNPGQIAAFAGANLHLIYVLMTPDLFFRVGVKEHVLPFHRQDRLRPRVPDLDAVDVAGPRPLGNRPVVPLGPHDDLGRAPLLNLGFVTFGV